MVIIDYFICCGRGMLGRQSLVTALIIQITKANYK